MFMPASRNEWLIAGGVIVAVALGSYLGYRYWRRWRAERALLEPFEAVSFDMLRDVLLPDGSGGQVHIDLLLLTAKGLLVVDLRHASGMIFGSESMDDWAVMDGNQRQSIKNPTGPLLDRIASVKLLAGDLPVDGRVVFTRLATFPKGRPPRVGELASLTREWPAADRAQQPSPVAGWSEAWASIRAASTPSPIARRR